MSSRIFPDPITTPAARLVYGTHTDTREKLLFFHLLGEFVPGDKSRKFNPGNPAAIRTPKLFYYCHYSILPGRFY